MMGFPVHFVTEKVCCLEDGGGGGMVASGNKHVFYLFCEESTPN